MILVIVKFFVTLELLIGFIELVKSNPISEQSSVYPNCPLSQLALTNSLPVEEDNPNEESSLSCGQQQTAAGGAAEQNVEWPWMVYVYELANCQQVCSGTLLDHKWVLTAASCFQRGFSNPGQYGVVLGSFQPGSEREIYRLVRLILLHPGYSINRGRIIDDVAMIELAKPIQSTRFVRPACLPPYGASPFSFTGRSCTVLRWRKMNSGGSSNRFSEIVHPLAMIVFSEDQCRNVTDSRRSDDVRLCARGRHGEGTCQADVGGPLLCRQPGGNYYVHGVVPSNHLVCGNGTSPSIFTSTGHPDINVWIRAVLSRI